MEGAAVVALVGVLVAVATAFLLANLALEALRVLATTLDPLLEDRALFLPLLAFKLTKLLLINLPILD